MRKSSLLVTTSLLATAAAAVGFSSAAFAADLGIPLKAEPVAPPPYSWTGCYIGAQVGGGLQTDAFANYEGGYYANGGQNQYGGGAIAGGQLGCNYQTGWQALGGAVVLGIEGDGFWSSMRNSNTYGYQYTDGEGYSETYKTQNKWDADIAARFGLAFGQTLLYSKLGAAWGHFNFSYTESYNYSPNYYSDNGSATLPGVLLGLGVEYAVLPHWTVKLEYDYYGYLQKSVAFNECYSGVCDTTYQYNETLGASKQIVKVGVNYKFW